ncbi:MAG: hypothetical protein GF329_09770 [Candidatus Lokiarchaeota archaeon]|nr:hypothetical protein [Candidatus Lokiarchaeota archaeon]
MMFCVYGPFLSRRIGLSLGIDLLAQNKIKKRCVYDCIYCEIGETPSIGYSSIDKRIKLEKEFIQYLEKRLSDVLKKEKNLDSITIGYSGEPTLIENLGEVINKIKPIRGKYCPNTPISIFTNSSTILDNKVCEALDKVDNIITKLDTADQNLFQLVNRPHRSVPHISKLIDGLKNYKKYYTNNNLYIQTMLINGKYSNTSSESLKKLASAYDLIKPDLIQMYSISRSPAMRSLVKNVYSPQLKELKNLVIEFLENEDLIEKIRIY